jgi:hypothetical protein
MLKLVKQYSLFVHNAEEIDGVLLASSKRIEVEGRSKKRMIQKRNDSGSFGEYLAYI